MNRVTTMSWTRQQVLVLLASVAGVGLSIYLSAVHYAGATPACPATSTINCEAVISSSYGVIAGSGVPTSLAGLVWFIVNAALWMRPMRRARLAWATFGLITVLYLVFVEIVQLGTICLWCTGVHLLVVFIFIVALMTRQETT